MVMECEKCIFLDRSIAFILSFERHVYCGINVAGCVVKISRIRSAFQENTKNTDTWKNLEGQFLCWKIMKYKNL
jgi:hypothetical protein